MEQVIIFSVDVMKSLQKGSLRDENVFCRCCFYLDETQHFYFTGIHKLELSQSLGISPQTIQKSLNSLVERGFITKVGKGGYTIDEGFAKKCWLEEE